MDVVSTLLSVAPSAVSEGSDRASRSRGGGECRCRCRCRGRRLSGSTVNVVTISRFTSHVLLLSGRVSSAAAKDRTSSSRPGTGTRAFSTRTSEVPERVETMISGGILSAARFGAALDLSRRAHGLGDEVVTARDRGRSSASIAALSSRQCRSARPAESA